MLQCEGLQPESDHSMTGPITPQRDPCNDWRPDSNPIYGKTNDLVEQAAKPVVRAAERGMAQGG